MDTTGYKGYTIQIDQDDMADNPLDWSTPKDRQGNVTFVLSHKRYDLPCEIDIDLGRFTSWDAVAKAVAKNKPHKFVRWYEHSGIAVSLRDDCNVNDWDAGIVGLIFGDTTEDIESYFKDWQAYTEGDVWSITVTDSNGNEIEDCSGYYGYDYASESAKQAVDSYQALPLSKQIKTVAASAKEYHK